MLFLTFFYKLRDCGLNVSLGEWLTLIEALKMGLHNSQMVDFYYLARAILVKSETDFDKFDMAFEDVFKSKNLAPDITDTMLSWLDKSDMNDLLHEMNRDYMNQMESAVIDILIRLKLVTLIRMMLSRNISRD